MDPKYSRAIEWHSQHYDPLLISILSYKFFPLRTDIIL